MTNHYNYYFVSNMASEKFTACQSHPSGPHTHLLCPQYLQFVLPVYPITEMLKPVITYGIWTTEHTMFNAYALCADTMLMSLSCLHTMFNKLL